jgi:hypothetical protein
MLKAVGYILSTALVVAISFVAVHFYGDWRTGKVYSETVRGQSEASIVRELGQPDSETVCGEHLWWDGEAFNPPANNGTCVKWVRYNYSLSAWAFGYSADGKLVSRYHYVSE